MNSIKNVVQLVGYAGANPELKETKSGIKYCTIRIATNEKTKMKSGEWRESTQWHNCVIWGELANYVQQQVKKGTLLMVHGSLQYREYVDKQNINRQVTEIRVDQILPLGLHAPVSVKADNRSIQEKEDALPF